MLMGVDGSGKSALSALLHNELSRRGIKSVMVWVGLRPVLLKPFILLAKFLLVRKHNKFENYKAHDRAKKSGMRKLAFLHKIYFLVLFIDYVPQVFFKVLLPSLLGRYVICDRYYHDLMLDYIVTINASHEKLFNLIHLSSRVFPGPNLAYFLSVPIEVAFERKNDIPSLEYLNERKFYYENIAKKLNIAYLDGTDSLTKNCNLILSDLERIKGST